MLFYTATFIAFIMLIWFKTDALIEWASFLRFDVSGFKRNKELWLPVSLNFPTFLKNKYDNFFTRMLSCSICLSIWLTVSICLIGTILLFDLTIMFYVPIISMLSLLIYGVTTLALQV